MLIVTIFNQLNKMTEIITQNIKQYKQGLFITLLALITVVILTFYLNLPVGWDFRNNLYLPIYLLLQQQSPYNIHVLVSQSNAVWLPMVFGIYLPFGYLNLQQANNFWWLANISALAAMTFITIGQKYPPRLKLILTVLLIFLFPSTASHLFLGQISILICLAFVVVIWFGERIPTWVVGFLFAFSLTKPQLSFVFIFSYFYTEYRQLGWRGIWKLGLWSLMGIVVLCLPMILIYPNWYRDFISNLMMNLPWAHPSIIVMLNRSFGLVGKMLSWIFIGFGIIMAFIGIERLGKKEGLLWSLALTPIISLYIWSWDFVFLYPLMIYSIFQQKTCFKSTLLFCGYFIVMTGFMTMKFIGTVEDSLNWWGPWTLIAITIIAKLFPEKHNYV
jgi:hypothetical protein